MEDAMKYAVEIGDGDGLCVEVDIGPNAPKLKNFELGFEVSTKGDLEHAIGYLGFDAASMDPTKTLHTRYGLPLTSSGEIVGRCNLQLWPRGELEAKAPTPPHEVLNEIVDAAKAAKADRDKQAYGTVDWDRSVVREVARG